MLRRGWLGQARTVEEIERALLEFLGIASIEEAPELPIAGLRNTESKDPEPRAQVAWVKRAENLARQQQLTAAFDRQRLEADLPELLASSVEPNAHCRVPSFLLDRGVHFVLVPHLPKTYLDGAAFTIDDHPVVGMTLRYDRVDYFWFTLTHELAHSSGPQGRHRRVRTRRGSCGDRRAGQRQGVGWLIEEDAYDDFLSATDRHPTRADILDFAIRSSTIQPSWSAVSITKEILAYGRHRDLLGEARRFSPDGLTNRRQPDERQPSARHLCSVSQRSVDGSGLER